jgi:hypothetical protein
MAKGGVEEDRRHANRAKRLVCGSPTFALWLALAAAAMVMPGVAWATTFEEDLEIHTTYTPTLKLDQWEPDCEVGPCPAIPPEQTWALSGSAGHFFVKDTDGEALPFRVQPGTPTGSLVVSRQGNVGIGTTSPASALEIHRFGAAEILYTDGGHASWGAGVPTGAGSFDIGVDGAPEPGMRLRRSGDLELTTGLLQMSSVDQVVMAVNGMVDPAEALTKVIDLPIREWRLSADPAGADHIGPLSEDLRSAFGVGSDSRSLTPSDEAGVALAAMQALSQIDKRLSSKVGQLEARAAAEESRIKAIEDLRLKVSQLAKRAARLNRRWKRGQR